MKNIIISMGVVSLGFCLVAVTFLFAESKEPQEQPARTSTAPAERLSGSPDIAVSTSGRTTSSRPRRASGPESELKQMYRQLEKQLARMEQLERAGKEGEIKEVQQEINKLEYAIERFEKQQRDNIDDERPDGRRDFPRVEPGFHGEPDMPTMDKPKHRPEDELRQRIEHIHHAARHLKEAGLHECVRDLMEEAKEMERDLHGNDVGKLVDLMHGLRREVKQLRREVHEMRKQMGGHDHSHDDKDHGEEAPGIEAPPARLIPVR